MLNAHIIQPKTATFWHLLLPDPVIAGQPFEIKQLHFAYYYGDQNM